jgi:ADP-ribose pyrophosphatase YjhB (NUDIX family)
VRHGRIAPVPFNFCPRCGHELVLREKDDGRLRPTCMNCKYTHYGNPALAVGVIVTDEQRRVCLILRGEEPRKGFWGLPAGFMEGDETAEQGAVRECLEETGLEVALDGLHAVYSYQHANRKTSGLLIVYRAHIVGGAPQPGTDTTDVKFFALDEIDVEMLAFETHRHAIETLRETLEHIRKP